MNVNENEKEEIESEGYAFEDNPMPILKASIAIQDKNRKVRVLIDSGAAINLISRELAEELEKNGIKGEREGNMRIKVANGKKMLVDKVFFLPLKISDRWIDRAKFFVLDHLPFDVLVGNPTLREWEADLSWKTHVFQYNRTRARTSGSRLVGKHIRASTGENQFAW